MKAKELAEILLKNPELEVWFNGDLQTGEGGYRVQRVLEEFACEADLDGDEISNEYYIVEEGYTVPNTIFSDPNYFERKIGNDRFYSQKVLILI